MEHPLIGNLDSLTVDQLTEKIQDLSKKLNFAYRTGNGDLCNQIRMALESYQIKYTEKTRKSGGADDFNQIIDIS